MRRDPRTPWSPAKIRERVRNFETVLNAYYPTVTDTRTDAGRRRVLRAAAAWRYHARSRARPLELNLLQRVFHYQRPETTGSEMCATPRCCATRAASIRPRIAVGADLSAARAQRADGGRAGGGARAAAGCRGHARARRRLRHAAVTCGCSSSAARARSGVDLSTRDAVAHAHGGYRCVRARSRARCRSRRRPFDVVVSGLRCGRAGSRAGRLREWARVLRPAVVAGLFDAPSRGGPAGWTRTFETADGTGRLPGHWHTPTTIRRVRACRRTSRIDAVREPGLDGQRRRLRVAAMVVGAPLGLPHDHAMFWPRRDHFVNAHVRRTRTARCRARFASGAAASTGRRCGARPSRRGRRSGRRVRLSRADQRARSSRAQLAAAAQVARALRQRARVDRRFPAALRDAIPTLAAARPDTLDDRVWVGGLKNLLSGVTTVCHHNPLHRPLRRRFPVRVVQTLRPQPFACRSTATASPRPHRDTPADWPWIIHAAEGVDEEARGEVETLDTLGAWAEHRPGARRRAFADASRRGARARVRPGVVPIVQSLSFGRPPMCAGSTTPAAGAWHRLAAERRRRSARRAAGGARDAAVVRRGAGCGR